MRWLFAGLVLAASGCGNLLGIDNFHLSSDARPPDGVADGAPDAAPVCYGAGTASGGLISPCIVPPTQPLQLGGVIDTSMDTACTAIVAQPGGPDACVVAGTAVTMSGDVTAIGTRPLVIVATGAITIDHALDASSTRVNPRAGAGADSTDCVAATNGTNSGANNFGGGAGAGGFGTKGGNGAASGNGVPGGTGGAAKQPTFVRGGCIGAVGGNSAATDFAHGGGGLYVIATSSITVTNTGAIYASGEGGALGNQAVHGAGSGGGSGGLIGLEAPTIDVQGILAANGGGGGEGSGSSSGQPGTDGTTMAYNQAAPGGATSTNNGGNGGNGAVLTNNGQAGLGSLGAGGAGGGGVGVIWVKSTGFTGAGKYSPPPTMH